MVVIHYTAMTSARAARDWLCEPEAQVSAHYVVSRRGEVWQLVEEEMRAWHAGAGAWGSVCDVNSRSIGIELANTGAEPFAEPQMAALEDLLRGILDRWRMPPERVIGHSDMAPGRKIDPGPRFDWRRLALRGLAVWPDEAALDDTGAPGALGDALRAIGYPLPEGAEPDDALRAAFAARFGGLLSGASEARLRVVAGQMAARYPVDRDAAKA